MSHAIRPETVRADQPRTAWRVGVIVVAVAIVLFVLATAIENAAIRVLRASENELEWVSDVVLSIFFGAVSFLWLRLRETRATLSIVERERIVLDTQLALAAQIQRAYLPAIPADTRELRWAARLEQTWQIGGDLYDFVEVDGTWIVIVGDVAGKGVPAALVTSSICTRLRMLTQETTDPGELVERLSSSIHDDHHGMPYFTCVLLRIDPRAHEIAYVNAGHPAAMVLPLSTAGDSRLIESTGLPAGMFGAQRYETHSIRIDEGAVFVIVTDGVTDALAAGNITWSKTARRLMGELPRPAIPAEVCDTLIERTNAAMAGQDWTDDRTVVAIAVGADEVLSGGPAA